MLCGFFRLPSGNLGRVLSGLFSLLRFLSRSFRRSQLATDSLLTLERSIALFGQGINGARSFGQSRTNIGRFGLGVLAHLLDKRQPLQPRNHVNLLSFSLGKCGVRYSIP